MVVLKCPIRGCKFRTIDETDDIVRILLDIHNIEHQQDAKFWKTGGKYVKDFRPNVQQVEEGKNSSEEIIKNMEVCDTIKGLFIKY